MWLKLAPYWRTARTPTYLGVLALLAAIGIELLLPWPVKWLVDHVLGSQPPPTWLMTILPAFSGSDKIAALLVVCVAGLLMAAAFRAATFVSQLLLIQVGGEVVFQLRARGYEQFCRLPIAYHDRTKLGAYWAWRKRVIVHVQERRIAAFQIHHLSYHFSRPGVTHKIAVGIPERHNSTDRVRRYIANTWRQEIGQVDPHRLSGRDSNHSE